MTDIKNHLSGHPRLLLKNVGKDEMREHLKTVDERVIGLYRKLLKTEITGIGATPEYGSYNMLDCLALEAKAFSAWLDGGETEARNVIENLLMLLGKFRVNKGIMGARWGGHLIFVASEVYDWCYFYLSEEEKNSILAKCEEIAGQYFEMGYPPIKQGPVSGHGSEAQLLRDLLAFSIAVYDERPDIYEVCAGRIFNEYIPANKFFFSCEAHTQGPAYGSYRYSWNLWAALIIKSLSGESIYDEHFMKSAYYYLYMTRPDGEQFRMGDDFIPTKNEATQKNPFFVPLMLASVYSSDPYCYKYADEHFNCELLLPSKHGIDYYDDGSYGEGVLSPTAYLIFDKMREVRREAEPLPKYKYFPYPLGMTVWNDKNNGVAVLMKAGELWGANHDHLDTGCFQVFYRGILASDSGVYDSYGTPHRRKYLIGTSAHNTLTVRDPSDPGASERREDIPDDGGTRRPNRGKEPKTITEWVENYNMARVIEHTESDELCYIKVDMTDAYSHTCENVIRTMSFMSRAVQHGVLTVTDEVCPKNEKSEVVFHLHTQTEPVIDGRDFRIINKGGMLKCHITEPTDTEITARGGDGNRFPDGDGNEQPPLNNMTDPEAGWGEVRVRALGDKKDVKISVVMEICDA